MDALDMLYTAGKLTMGPIVDAGASVYHSGAAAYDMYTDDAEGAKEHAGKAGYHALKVIPGVGQVMSGAELVHDNVVDEDEPSLVEKFTDWIIPYDTDKGSDEDGYYGDDEDVIY